MRVRFKFIAKLLCAGLIVVSCVLVLVVWGITYHPQPVEPVAVTGTNAAPLLKPGQKLKILSWNVQYLAGKEHVFWYDVRLGGHSVRQKDPGKTEYLRISDHFPVIAEITVP